MSNASTDALILLQDLRKELYGGMNVWTYGCLLIKEIVHTSIPPHVHTYQSVMVSTMRWRALSMSASESLRFMMRTSSSGPLAVSLTATLP